MTVDPGEGPKLPSDRLADWLAAHAHQLDDLADRIDGLADDD